MTFLSIPVPLGLDWKHVTDLPLADPQFGQPGRIDILLEVDVFTDVCFMAIERAYPLSIGAHCCTPL